MTADLKSLRPRRCVFCRMPTRDRFLRLPMGPICRDQSCDFLLASAVAVVMAPIVGISGTQFSAPLLFLVAPSLAIAAERVRSFLSVYGET